MGTLPVSWPGRRPGGATARASEKFRALFQYWGGRDDVDELPGPALTAADLLLVGVRLTIQTVSSVPRSERAGRVGRSLPQEQGGADE